MAISNCLFSPTPENPLKLSVWCMLFRHGQRDGPQEQSQFSNLIKK